MKTLHWAIYKSGAPSLEAFTDLTHQLAARDYDVPYDRVEVVRAWEDLSGPEPAYRVELGFPDESDLPSDHQPDPQG
jgi:hypothetical protein